MGCGKKKPPAEAGGFSKAKQRSQLVGALGIHGIGTILDPILADGILRSVLVHPQNLVIIDIGHNLICLVYFSHIII